MLAEIGLLSTFFALIAALYAIGAALYGARIRSERWVLSARNAAVITFPLLLVASLMLLVALINGQYQIKYVWTTSDPNTPFFYRVTALWGSQAGSILFWSLLMSAFAASAIWLKWNEQRRLMPYVIAYTMAVLAFFVMLTVFLENPFERFWIMPNDQIAESTLQPAGGIAPATAQLATTANGLNPLLRHFGMIIHPPMLYLGFVSFIIPFAFAMAALASGDLSTNWIKSTRRWSLAAWVFLALGLILGGRWAYDVLGWGGYWGWDPVENAAFLPWLIGTAFLHSVMIQEKRGMLKVWNMVLAIGTFSAVIFGTFATRSGLVDSVHSFARSEIGFPLFFFWAGTTLLSAGLILWRWRRGELKDERRFASLLSRESLFVWNNVIFVLLYLAIFWGSFGAPVVSELFFGTDITLGRDYFMSVTPPLFFALFVLMGVAPLSAWGVSSLRKLGAGLLPAAVLSLLLVGVLAIVTPINVAAAIGYFVVSLGGFVVLVEMFRALRARAQTHRENPLRALWAMFMRNQRRYGGYIIHLGVVVIGIGAIGSALFQQETQRTMKVGDSLALGGYEMTYEGFLGGQIADDTRVMDIAQVTLRQGGNMVASLRPRRDFYPTARDMNSMTIAGVHSTIVGDFYVLLVGWEEIAATGATFKVYYNPLINLVWWGGLILLAGTIIAVFPRPLTEATVEVPAKAVGAQA